jgi:hypothetical protein
MYAPPQGALRHPRLSAPRICGVAWVPVLPLAVPRAGALSSPKSPQALLPGVTVSSEAASALAEARDAARGGGGRLYPRSPRGRSLRVFSSRGSPPSTPRAPVRPRLRPSEWTTGVWMGMVSVSRVLFLSRGLEGVEAAVGSRQWAVGGGRWTVDGGRRQWADSGCSRWRDACAPHFNANPPPSRGRWPAKPVGGGGRGHRGRRSDNDHATARASTLRPPSTAHPAAPPLPTLPREGGGGAKPAVAPSPDRRSPLARLCGVTHREGRAPASQRSQVPKVTGSCTRSSVTAMIFSRPVERTSTRTATSGAKSAATANTVSPSSASTS